MLSAVSLKDHQDSKKILKQAEIDYNIFVEVEERVSGAPSYNSPISRERNDNNNTLGSLTQTFVTLIKQAPNQSIEIDEVSKQLKIQKRRIYDITNVLEGIGYIQKLGKNKMKWVGGERGSQLQYEALELQRKHEDIQSETKKIENQIEEMKTELLNLSSDNSLFNFLKIEDIIAIMKSLQVTQLLLYAGGIGDQIENDSNPEKRTSQCTIESNAAETKLYYCKLQEDDDLQVIENSFPEQRLESIKKEKEKEYPSHPNDIFHEPFHDHSPPHTPDLAFDNDFNLNIPLFDLSPSLERSAAKSKAQEQFFESDSNQ